MFSVPISNNSLKSSQNTIKAVATNSDGFYNIFCTIYYVRVSPDTPARTKSST